MYQAWHILALRTEFDPEAGRKQDLQRSVLCNAAAAAAVQASCGARGASSCAAAWTRTARPLSPDPAPEDEGRGLPKVTSSPSRHCLSAHSLMAARCSPQSDSVANMDSLLRKGESGSLHGASADEPYRTGVIASFRDFGSLKKSFDPRAERVRPRGRHAARAHRGNRRTPDLTLFPHGDKATLLLPFPCPPLSP